MLASSCELTVEKMCYVDTHTHEPSQSPILPPFEIGQISKLELTIIVKGNAVANRGEHILPADSWTSSHSDWSGEASKALRQNAAEEGVSSNFDPKVC